MGISEDPLLLSPSPLSVSLEIQNMEGEMSPLPKRSMEISSSYFINTEIKEGDPSDIDAQSIPLPRGIEGSAALSPPLVSLSDSLTL